MSGTIKTHLAMVDHRTVAGFAYDPDRPERRLVVEILADGVAIAAVIADAFSPALQRDRPDDPRHGFVHTLADRLVPVTRMISARIANLDIAVGTPIDLDAVPNADPAQASAGMVETVEAGTIGGWVVAASGVAAVAVEAHAAGELVATTIARTFASRPIGGEMRSVLLFTLALPDFLRDGRAHAIDLKTSGGLPLAGSPVRLPAQPK